MFTKIIIISIVFSVSLLVMPQRLESPDIKILTLDEYLQQVFGDKAPLMKAVFMHESGGMKLDAVNYNCIYNGKSTFCKKEDKSKAWSVDCGAFQINVRGKVCPKEYFTIHGSIPKVEEIYRTQGPRAWVSYKSGAYKQFMKT